jgi:hypothetical protein
VGPHTHKRTSSHRQTWADNAGRKRGGRGPSHPTAPHQLAGAIPRDFVCFFIPEVVMARVLVQDRLPSWRQRGLRLHTQASPHGFAATQPRPHVRHRKGRPAVGGGVGHAHSQLAPSRVHACPLVGSPQRRGRSRHKRTIFAGVTIPPPLKSGGRRPGRPSAAAAAPPAAHAVRSVTQHQYSSRAGATASALASAQRGRRGRGAPRLCLLRTFDWTTATCPRAGSRARPPIAALRR